jgi:hypothetical protein
MRAAHFAALLALLCAACDPRRPQLWVTPAVCPGSKVRVVWRAAEPTTPVRIFANRPTTPGLQSGDPGDVWRSATGSMDVVVGDQDTTFTAAVPGGGSVQQTTRVRFGTRSEDLHFTGQCRVGIGGPPEYGAWTVSGSGRLLRLDTNATRPVEVMHGGAVISIPPGGINLSPPFPPFEGSYQIVVSKPLCETVPPPVVPEIILLLFGDCPEPVIAAKAIAPRR